MVTIWDKKETNWPAEFLVLWRKKVKVKSLSYVWLFATPWSPTGLLCPWDFPGKNTGVGCHFLSQEIFLTQGLNSYLPHCRQTCYHLRVPNKYLFNLPKVFGHCLENHLFSFHILFLISKSTFLFSECFFLIYNTLSLNNFSSLLHSQSFPLFILISIFHLIDVSANLWCSTHV